MRDHIAGGIVGLRLRLRWTGARCFRCRARFQALFDALQVRHHTAVQFKQLIALCLCFTSFFFGRFTSFLCRFFFRFALQTGFFFAALGFFFCLTLLFNVRTFHVSTLLTNFNFYFFRLT